MSRKLPVFAALGHSFAMTFRNLGMALRISWAWLLVGAGVLGLSIAALLSEGAVTTPGVLKLLALIYVLVFLAMTSIAVAWHRYILLDDGYAMVFNLRVDKAVWRYMGNVIAILITLVAAAIPFGIVAALTGAEIVTTLAVVFLMPLFYRMSIKLPSIALGKTDLTFSDALSYSRGNYWPLLGLSTVVLTLSILVERAGKMLLGIGAGLGTPGVVFTGILAVMLSGVLAIFTISILTSLYGYFIEEREFG